MVERRDPRRVGDVAARGDGVLFRADPDEPRAIAVGPGGQRRREILRAVRRACVLRGGAVGTVSGTAIARLRFAVITTLVALPLFATSVARAMPRQHASLLSSEPAAGATLVAAPS